MLQTILIDISTKEHQKHYKGTLKANGNLCQSGFSMYDTI